MAYGMTQHARFSARRANFDGPSGSSSDGYGDGFGVWDAAVNGWHGPHNLTRDEAQQRAATIEADFRAAIAARAQRGVDRRVDRNTRVVNPPKDVLIQLADDAPWVPGRLHSWHRENGVWSGEVTVGDDARKRQWFEEDYIRQRDALAASDGS